MFWTLRNFFLPKSECIKRKGNEWWYNLAKLGLTGLFLGKSLTNLPLDLY